MTPGYEALPVVWSGLEAVPDDLAGSVVAIGVFDGVHRGHQVLLRRAHDAARARGVPAVAVTFDPNPVTVVRPGVRPPEQLVTMDRRVELLLRAGADAVCVVRFTSEFAQIEPEDFVTGVLVGRLRVSAVVVGADFRFGHRAAGDAGLLRSLGERLGFAVDAVPLVSEPAPAASENESQATNGAWSSTAVRKHVAVGEVAAAALILGRPHRVEGVVVHGEHRGRRLGFPTANLQVAPSAAIPGDGIYSGWLVRSDGEVLPAAVSVGANPTFDGVGRGVEAYVLGRDDLDLYGEHVAVDFVSRLRAMERFESVDALVEQMRQDVTAASAELLG